VKLSNTSLLDYGPLEYHSGTNAVLIKKK